MPSHTKAEVRKNRKRIKAINRRSAGKTSRKNLIAGSLTPGALNAKTISVFKGLAPKIPRVTSKAALRALAKVGKSGKAGGKLTAQALRGTGGFGAGFAIPTKRVIEEATKFQRAKERAAKRKKRRSLTRA